MVDFLVEFILRELLIRKIVVIVKIVLEAHASVLILLATSNYKNLPTRSISYDPTQLTV